MQSKLHGLWQVNRAARNEGATLHQELHQLHAKLRPDLHIENSYLLADPGVATQIQRIEPGNSISGGGGRAEGV